MIMSVVFLICYCLSSWSLSSEKFSVPNAQLLIDGSGIKMEVFIDVLQIHAAFDHLPCNHQLCGDLVSRG